MRVVSNTSPISNLAIIGKLSLLEKRYGKVTIPSEVASELSRLTHLAAREAIEVSMAAGWLRRDGNDLVPGIAKLPFALDAGELAAIALAIEIQADVLLIDEKRGRTAARRVNLKIGGLLGELLYAKRLGWIQSLRLEIDMLRNEAGFFVDEEIERFILSQAGE